MKRFKRNETVKTGLTLNQAQKFIEGLDKAFICKSRTPNEFIVKQQIWA